jgi:peptidyl-dipeptidase A
MKSLVSLGAVAIALAFATPALAAPTAAEADAFVKSAEQQLTDAFLPNSQAQWIDSTYINDDSDGVAAYFDSGFTALQVKLATEAATFNGTPGLSFDTARKLNLLRNSIVLASPKDKAKGDELALLKARLQSAYGKGKGTLNGKPINGSDIEAAMGKSRNPAETAEMWTSWHDNVGAPMRADYTRMVAIANEGAKELGYADTGAMWRSGYDMTPEQFAALTDKLWAEVKPLYDQLHCYTRAKLNAKYGDAVQKKTGPIRADLLGNMWAQEWGNIYDVVAPAGAGDLGYDVGDLLKAKGLVETTAATPEADRAKGEKQMFKYGEGFYSSLGFAPLPDSFWERTQFIKPRDRDVVCHASAWDVDNKTDLRIKMCTKINSDDFVTIHHEMGHNYYQRAYNTKSYLYLDSANDGFHEAIGDTMALSITPQYLVDIGLLDKSKVPAADKDIGLLLRQAMDKVAFLPFGLLVDKWRWGVFSGQIAPANYEKGWTDLRLQYQGIVPPSARDESKFDPGAKFHVPGNTPYTRYFLARLLQFQFYQAACSQAGWKGPLHRCSFYNNKAVGEKLNAMLAMGKSKPWPEALEAFTGTRELSGKAMLAYFAPLQAWLKKQNAGQSCGWQS